MRMSPPGRSATPEELVGVELRGLPVLGSKGPAIAGCYYTDDLVTQPFGYENGAVLVPNGPGLGVEVNPEKLAKYAVK